MDLELKLVGQTVGYIQVSEEDVLKIKTMPNIITRWDLKIIKKFLTALRFFFTFSGFTVLNFYLTVNQIEHIHLDNYIWNLYPPSYFILYLVWRTRRNLYPPSYSVFSYESGELDGTYILPPILYLVMSLEN